MSNWLHISPLCGTKPLASVIIDIGNLEPRDNDANKHLEVAVSWDSTGRNYSKGGADDHEVIVACQPKSAETELVLALLEVGKGGVNVDALWLLLQV